MKKITLIANWKMYLKAGETLQLTEKLHQLQEQTTAERLLLMLAPTLPLIPTLPTNIKNAFTWCAQDCSEHALGAYTGQIAAETIKAIGCKACIIGHSERRKHNGESNEAISRKLQQLLTANVSPIVCIGEESQATQGRIAIAQLQQQFNAIFNHQTINDIAHTLPLYVAYEPCWSIGTGVIPSRSYIEDVFEWLYQATQSLSAKVNWQLLYGGSVNNQNIESFTKITKIQGYLIGKASLDFQEFEKIVKCIMVE